MGEKTLSLRPHAERIETKKILNGFGLQALCLYGQRKVKLQTSTNLVGLITIAPISPCLSLVSRRISRSRIGMTKARVFPEPVTASTTTSLCFMKRGMVEACTGVICVCPIDCMTSRLLCISTSLLKFMLKNLHPSSKRRRKRRPNACKSSRRRHFKNSGKR